PASPQRIQADGLTFSYPGAAAPAVQDVSLELRRGEIVALVGQNGSGKTTLAKLLAHLYRPTSGRVLWDGIDISSYDAGRVRRRVAVLFQDFARYHLAAHENIAFGDVDRLCDHAGVVGAAQGAGADQFLARLDQGYDTVLSRIYGDGADLSVGQWQRVALARTAFREADLIVLDEPTAALDPYAEAQLFRRLRELAFGRAVLLISHRFSTVRSADRIYVLDGGRITEHGTHEELVASRGRYAQLFRLQAAPYLGDHARAGVRREDARPRVSVIIAAYDEEEHIGRCLARLRTQTYDPIEIIVVDDGSRDRTGAIVAGCGDVRLLRQPHLGPAIARNRGAEQATGEILVFIDADMDCPTTFIERLVAPMLERGVTGTFTKEIMVANGHRRWARAHMLGRSLPADCHFRPDFPDRFEIFRAIWRDDFWRVGGFDEVGHGEDVTLGRKLGIDAVAAPGATCYHHEPDRLGDIFSSARWVGRGERLRETPSWRRQYRPDRSLRRAASLAVRHRMPSLLLYRLVWDTGVLFGASTRDRAGSAK
ncbi:MAG TPA: ATP-binding cassette domain-containing protein, partial [Nitriliruptorales bacterium]|nr:ATP-binding cassette domain-containing protein [Nitriliruptorales bacterium]